MTLFVVAVIVGLAVLVWGADRFVEGAASVARHLGMPALVVGMVVVGFGTSAPELVVSTIAAAQGTPDIALGNAIGSNIANIGLILGLTAILSPIVVRSRVLRRELPLLVAVTLVAIWLLWDLTLSRPEAVGLLLVFAGVMAWTLRQGATTKDDAFGEEVEGELDVLLRPMRPALLWLAVGLIALIASSRLLVWGAVGIADRLGVDDLVVGLTVVAVGTSLPELASSIIAARRNEHDIALGNILGSNLFNTLAVVGLAGLVDPIEAAPATLRRDLVVMGLVTFSLVVLGWGMRRLGRINRVEGAALLVAFVAYTAWLTVEVIG